MVNGRAIGYIKTTEKEKGEVVVTVVPLQYLDWEKRSFDFRTRKEAEKWVDSLIKTIKESCK